MAARDDLLDAFRVRHPFAHWELDVVRALIELGEKFGWRGFFMSQQRIAEHAGVTDTLVVRHAVEVAVSVGLLHAEKVRSRGYSRYRYDFGPALALVHTGAVQRTSTLGANVVSIADYQRRRAIGPVHLRPVGGDAA